MLPGGDPVRTAAGHESASTGENVLAHIGSHETGGDRDFFYSRTGLRDPLFGAGRSPGTRFHTNGGGLSILRHVSLFALGGANRKGHFIERGVRGFVAGYF